MARPTTRDFPGGSAGSALELSDRYRAWQADPGIGVGAPCVAIRVGTTGKAGCWGG